MFLWKSIVYGPVYSRRLGYSLGVNLLPTIRKVCNFNCVYCECGLNVKRAPKQLLPTVEQCSQEMLRVFERLSGEGQQIDHITFAGNGEPTLHPSFGEIIELTRHFRDRYYPKAKIAVLSDAATLANQQVMKSLKEVDKPILKLDAGTDNTFQEIDRPENKISLDDITDLLKSFHGGLYIQTLFLRGVVNGKLIDNTTRFEIRKWVDRLKQIRPELVMIYGIDREPPYSTLEKVTSAKLRKIAEEVKSVGMDADWY